jgi:hypothetical protein
VSQHSRAADKQVTSSAETQSMTQETAPLGSRSPIIYCLSGICVSAAPGTDQPGLRRG